jgi:hypothetical protein
MSNPSNLYVEKIFAEQPLAVWALDDKLDYVSLISENKRSLLSSGDNSWTIENGTASTGTIAGPVKGTTSYSVEGVETPDEESTSFVTLKSSNLFETNSLNEDLGSFSISTYIYRDFANIKSVQLGYQINSSTPIFGKVNSLISGIGLWGLISETFENPQASGNVKIIIKIGYVDEPKPFEIHAITVGQWSESFQKNSLGVTLEPVLQDTVMEGSIGIKASSYGFGENSGYYIQNNNKLGAKNFGTPMVYGSSSITTLNSISGPSLVVPGLGFLNESGQFRDLTLEFWLRANSGSSEPRKICGPVSSDDGLYIDGSFLRLKINNNIGSYFVGEWGRPMLLDLSVINNSASLLLNGEKIISLSFDSSSLRLPSVVDVNNKSQDLIAFYSYEDIGPIQIDAIAVYPYLVTQIVAKRRFVYGQGVDVPQNINSSYSTSSVVVDYSFANYANNYNYPSVGRWQNGILNNLSIEENSISSPDYKLPAIVFENRSEQEWLSDLKEKQTQSKSFISFKPGESWNGSNAYMLFSSVDLLTETNKGFYGAFVKTNDNAEKETLVKILDKNTKDYLEVSISGTKLSYNIFANNQNLILKEVENIAINNEFFVGLNFDLFSLSYGKAVASFFNNKTQLEVYVAGTKEFQNTFSGNIYNFSFFNSDKYLEISKIFDNDGTLKYSESLLSAENSGEYDEDYDYFGEDSNYLSEAFDQENRINLVDKIGSYTIILNRLISEYYLDIAISGYWKDYVPLSYLSKYVKNANNNFYYSLDFIQLNLDNPKNFNNSNTFIRSYVSFKSLKETAYQTENFYTNKASYVPSMSIEPSSQWAVTKYEFRSGDIVYPPVDTNIQDLSVFVSLEFSVLGILQNPAKIKSLELASQAYNDLTPSGISTKNGIPMFPYTKNGIYFDYKRRNPISIYKGSSPHLYLTNSSGIRLAGDQKIGLSRGVSMPINQSSSSSYGVGAFQFFGRYNETLFPTAAQELFEIESADKYIKFYIQATDSTRKRGKVYAFNTISGRLEQGVVYSLNGIETGSLILESNQWFVLGIQFPNPILFNNIQGAFRLTGSMTVNNVSHYKYTAFQQRQVLVSRPWGQVLAPEGVTKNWEYWETDFTWNEVLYVLSLQKQLIDLKQIYKEYMGINKRIISDEIMFRLKNYKYVVYDDLVWQNETISAV